MLFNIIAEDSELDLLPCPASFDIIALVSTILPMFIGRWGLCPGYPFYLVGN